MKRLPLTIAICTWNRSALLRQALGQMKSLVIPETVDLEIIVVNNNSTDDTDAAIEAFQDSLPIRRIFEAKPGQSHARNTAAHHARGAYILWTDDDVVVETNWVVAYAKAFTAYPEGVVYGGPILPAFACAPPRWVTEAWPALASAYATRDLGPEAVRFDGAARMPFGANFVVRAAEQKAMAYDPALGLTPGGSIRGDETDVVNRLLDLGYQGWWVPGAGVRHYIPSERLTTGYVRRYFEGHGAAEGGTELQGGVPRLLGRPRWAWRRAVTAEAKYRVHRAISPPAVWIKHLQAASTAWGALFGARRRS